MYFLFENTTLVNSELCYCFDRPCTIKQDGISTLAKLELLSPNHRNPDQVTSEASWVGGWAGGHMRPLASEIFRNFKTLYLLRMCVMMSCDLNVSVRRKNIKLCPPYESLPTTLLGYIRLIITTK